MGILALGLGSCDDDEENTTIGVQDTVETGAVLRTISFTDELLLDVDNPPQFVLEIEEQDEFEGELLESVNLFVTYADNSAIAGNSSSINTEEVLLRNIPASEFFPGPFGLPRAEIIAPLSETLAAIGGTFDDIYVDDTFTFREELILTDGRVFSVNNAGGIITAGFFNSPFQHVQTVTGGINLSFRESGLNEINIAEGQPNDGYQTILQVQEAVEDLWDQTEIFVRYVDNNDDGTDNSTQDTSLGIIPRADFTLPALDQDNDDEPIEMAIGGAVNISLESILTGIGLGLDELFEDDEVIIRFSVRNFAGREISSLEEPFSVIIPVVSCPIAPIADADTFGVGMYNLEITSGVFPDFGVTVDFMEGPYEIVSTNGLNREIANVPFLPEFNNGGFPTTIPFSFSCDRTLVPTHFLAGGLGCDGENFDITGESTDTVFGEFDSLDDTTFTLSFTIFAPVGTCPSVPYTSTLTFTRI